MGFFTSLLIILGIQFLLEFIFYYLLNFSIIWVSIIIDLVLAIVFTLFNFRGRDKLNNPDFHKSIAIYFAILTAFTVLFNYVL